MQNINNPSVPQDYSWMYVKQGQQMQQALPEQEESTFEPKEKDPNLWKPVCTKESPDYAAVVRILPQGMVGAQNPTMRPEIHVLKHYLKNRAGKQWGEPVLCRHMVPDPTTGKASRCPLCDSIWNRYNLIKDTQGQAAAKNFGVGKFLPQEEIYANILFRNDENQPQNINQVKVWQATTHQWELAETPLPENEKSPKRKKKDAQDSQQNQGQAKKVHKIARKSDTGVKFHPSNVIEGADFTIIAEWDDTKVIGTGDNARNGIPDYDGSYFADQTTPLAMRQVQMQDGSIQWVPDEAAICNILSQCHDLNQYRGTVLGEQEMIALTERFWAEYDGTTPGQQNNVQPTTYNGQMAMAQQNQQAYAPYQQASYVQQGQIPNTPPAAKVSNGNAVAFMAPQNQQTSYVQPQYQAPAQNAAPAFNAAQPQYQAPVQQNVQPQPAMQNTAPSFNAQPQYQAPAQNTAPVQTTPTQSTYVPPPATAAPQNTAPAFNGGQQYQAPAQGNAFNGVAGASDDDDLPF